MNIPQSFTNELSLPEQIVYILSVLPNATADEVAMEIMELKGIATEEGVANLTVDVKNELLKMRKDHFIKEITTPDHAVRYFLN